METQRHADSAGQCTRQKDGGWVSVLAFKLNISELLVSSSGANVTELKNVFKQPPPTQTSQNTALTGLIKGQVKVGYFQ